MKKEVNQSSLTANDSEINVAYYELKAKNDKIIKKVFVTTLVINILLSIAKMIFGLVFDNLSVISDAINDVADIGTGVLIMVAVLISKPHADNEHNYGHEKFESLLVLFFSIILGVVGGSLFISGFKSLLSPSEKSLNWFLLGVTISSIALKEGMYWYTMHYYKITKSATLKSDAWHHRSDSLSSAAVLIGLIGCLWVKNDLFESIAILIVSVLIFVTAIQILVGSVNQLIDRAASPEAIKAIEEIIKANVDVKRVDLIQTRLFGSAIYVDCEISVDANITVEESHKIAQEVHDSLEEQTIFLIKHCNVHVNPFISKNNDELA